MVGLCKECRHFEPPRTHAINRAKADVARAEAAWDEARQAKSSMFTSRSAAIEASLAGDGWLIAIDCLRFAELGTCRRFPEHTLHSPDHGCGEFIRRTDEQRIRDRAKQFHTNDFC